MKTYVLLIFIVMFTSCASAQSEEKQLIHSEEVDFILTRVIDNIEYPWSLAFLPQNGGILITERPGRLNLLLAGQLFQIKGLPQVASVGQGGLMDVIIDPFFINNQYIYISFTESGPGGFGTAVARARLKETRLEEVEVIFRALPKSNGGRHFGSRLLFGADGLLYITLGERGVMSNAQNLNHHGGSVVRIRSDGSIPMDNPFLNTPDALPELYSYGHRNPQGIVMDQDTNLIWLHEHGPKGGDEVNILRSGGNYGWPIITYGIDYDGSIISSETQKPGMEQPVVYWTPSIAPSGMSFYYGNKFPEWKGDIFVGALAGQQLRRLVIKDNRVIDQEILLHNKIGRIRDVRLGPDGFLYLLTDDKNGMLYKIGPVESN